ncbi:siderophore-iron reductase FhuF [Salmonella enterica]
MAYRSAPIADDIIWRAAPQPEDASLADAVRETIASTRKHLLDFIRLDETPPLMLALLTQARAINVSAEHIHVEFHETGRAACFWLDVHQDNLATERSPEERMETLIVSALQPVIQALEATGDINAKLIWSNTGYLINWYLTEMKPLLGEALLATLRQRCFFEKQLSDGQDNPLWRTVVMRDGLLVRRTCCQRYRLPDVQQCGDCTLK